MGGELPMGGQSSSRSDYSSNTLSAREQKDWTACQTMPGDQVAKNKRCARLKKKSDRIAAQAE
jgi:hypothetical protein